MLKQKTWLVLMLTPIFFKLSGPGKKIFMMKDLSMVISTQLVQHVLVQHVRYTMYYVQWMVGAGGVLSHFFFACGWANKQRGSKSPFVRHFQSSFFITCGCNHRCSWTFLKATLRSWSTSAPSLEGVQGVHLNPLIFGFYYQVTQLPVT